MILRFIGAKSKVMGVQSSPYTSLKKSIVHLDVAHDVCKEGVKLAPEQARLLKLFELMRAE
jgi:hypothetical protein